MQSMQKQEESLPLLLFLLQYHRFGQLIKAMLNETVSHNLLTECGYSLPSASSLEQFKAKESASRFSIQELIYLKGSSYERPKEFVNQPLLDLLRRKLVTELPSAETRKVLWVQFTEIYEKPHFYQQLKQLQLPTEFQIAIQKDILRTYKPQQIKSKTQQTLSLFASYNPYIGYCQGMNSIFAFLLENSFTPQQSFFIFKHITQHLLPCEYYSSMDSIMAYMRIFYQVLAVTHPNCYGRIREIGREIDGSYVGMVSFVLQWFVCLFCVQGVREDVTRVVWDFFVLEGVVVLFKAGLAMFDFLEPHILKCNNFEQYTIMQKKHIRQITDISHIRKRLSQTFISPQLLSILKQKLLQQDEKNKKKTQKRPTKNQKKKCNRKWNVCFQGLDRHLANNFAYEFFVFKAKGELNIVDNYLGKMDKIYFNNTEKSKDMVDDLLIGRVEHICQPQEDLFTDDSISDKNAEGRELRKRYAESLSDPKSPIKIDEQGMRKKAALKVQEVMKKKPGMQRSESMVFMQEMVQNTSLSNLLQLYDLDEIFET